MNELEAEIKKLGYEIRLLNEGGGNLCCDNTKVGY